jgi:hypothetical protein
MKLPPSRLLTRLDTEIAAERDPLRADLLRAERAAYLIRQGQSDLATSELAALHQKYDGRPNVEMSAWLSLAGSLASYLSDLEPAAIDKMRRSRALSEAAGLARTQALSAAWLAQMEYGRHEFAAMAGYVRESLKLAAVDHHSARSRASMVVALSLHLCGQMAIATTWYMNARDHAVAEGDNATISALMHNMSWLRMHALRQEQVVGSVDGAAGLHARIGIESTMVYDHLQGISTLEPLKPILQAQIHALEGRPAEALMLFNEHMANQPEGMSRFHCTVLADRAWCLLQTGQADNARIAAADAEASFLTETQVDDRASTHSRLADIFGILGEVDKAEQHRVLARDCWQKFAELQGFIAEQLADISAAVPS